MLIPTIVLLGALAAAPQEPLRLWSGPAPGEKGDIGPEHDTSPKGPDGKPTDNIVRLGDVSVPTLTVYKPAKGKANGASVIVCPGGGYHILAWDLEGTEVCRWLNSIGVTGILLKYRVPSHRDTARFPAPLQDAQRAVRLVRSHAAAWGLDPKRVGILGFSAGGNLIVRLTSDPNARVYDPADAADALDARPDFSVLVYPYIGTDERDRSKLAQGAVVSAATPPAFLVMTQDDPIGVEGVYAYAAAMKAAKVSAELHVFPTGGHGYGLRPSEHAVANWPVLAAAWMKHQGWLKKAGR
jgi:acetyl esterase/lipase